MALTKHWCILRLACPVEESPLPNRTVFYRLGTHDDAAVPPDSLLATVDAEKKRFVSFTYTDLKTAQRKIKELRSKWPNVAYTIALVAFDPEDTYDDQA